MSDTPDEYPPDWKGRRTYVFRDGRCIPKIYAQSTQPEHGLTVIQDIAPYRSMVTGEQITGRRQHREHLRAHGLQEVGNEKPKPPAAPDFSRETRSALRDAYNQLRLQGRI